MWNSDYLLHTTGTLKAEQPKDETNTLNHEIRKPPTPLHHAYGSHPMVEGTTCLPRRRLRRIAAQFRMSVGLKFRALGFKALQL